MIAQKILAHDSALDAWLRQASRPLVFTNGCFDLLHRGHVTLLEEARALGEALIVGVNTDHSVRQQEKGDDRPFTPLEDRLAVLAALESVDAVVAFDSPTPADLIQRITPEHLVKGGDWPADQIVGASWVQNHGGQAHSLPFKFQRSTTDLARRIRGA